MGQEAEGERVPRKSKARKLLRTTSSLLAGALMLGLVGSYTASAHLEDQRREGQLQAPETITLRLAPPQDAKFVDVDLRKQGPSRGDLVYIRYPIFDEGGEQAGHTFAICEQFTPKPRLYYCQEEDHILGRGTVLSAGFQDLAVLPITVLQIVGGTGEFKNAGGQSTLDFEAGTITFELLP